MAEDGDTLYWGLRWAELVLCICVFCLVFAVLVLIIYECLTYKPTWVPWFKCPSCDCQYCAECFRQLPNCFEPNPNPKPCCPKLNLSISSPTFKRVHCCCCILEISSPLPTTRAKRDLERDRDDSDMDDSLSVTYVNPKYYSKKVRFGAGDLHSTDVYSNLTITNTVRTESPL